MNQPRALDIPELRLHIGSYLELDDRRACALVCKAWNINFQPLVWDRFSLVLSNDPELMTAERQIERLESIRKNARWIQHLEAAGATDTNSDDDDDNDNEDQGEDEDDSDNDNDGNDNDDQGETADPACLILVDCCRSLATMHAKARNDAEWAAFKQLVQVNTGLQEVELSHLPTAEPDYTIHEVVQGHGQLRSLVLGCSVSALVLLRILDACPLLEHLNVGYNLWKHPIDANVDGDTGEDDTEEDFGDSMTDFRLQGLGIQLICDDPSLSKVLRRCPKLYSLGLYTLTFPVLPGISKLFADGRLALVRKIYLGRGLPFDHYPHEAFINAIPQHQLEQAWLSEPHPEVIRAVVRSQHKSLEALWVDRARDITALAVVPMVCSRLKEFLVDSSACLDARYLIDQPWACTDLRLLLLPVGIDRECQDPALLAMGSTEKEQVAPGLNEYDQVNILFFKRLGQLTNVRSIDLSRFTASSPVSHLRWYLSFGLRQLADLSSLEALDLGCGGCWLSVAELQFMKEHWPNLSRLTYTSLENGGKQWWLNENWPSLEVEWTPHH